MTERAQKSQAIRVPKDCALTAESDQGVIARWGMCSGRGRRRGSADEVGAAAWTVLRLWRPQDIQARRRQLHSVLHPRHVHTCSSREDFRKFSNNTSSKIDLLSGDGSAEHFPIAERPVLRTKLPQHLSHQKWLVQPANFARCQTAIFIDRIWETHSGWIREFQG